MKQYYAALLTQSCWGGTSLGSQFFFLFKNHIILCMINLIFLNTAVLIVIYLTDAIIEYGGLFRLSKLLKLKEYQELRVDCEQLNYPTFLLLRKNNFLTRLFSCPLCFGFWLSLSLTFANNQVESLATVYLSSLFLFFIFKKIYG